MGGNKLQVYDIVRLSGSAKISNALTAVSLMTTVGGRHDEERETTTVACVVCGRL
jgi:hypothetical protein